MSKCRCSSCARSTESPEARRARAMPPSLVDHGGIKRHAPLACGLGPPGKVKVR